VTIFQGAPYSSRETITRFQLNLILKTFTKIFEAFQLSLDFIDLTTPLHDELLSNTCIKDA
jgi:hypothetical protein